MRVRFLIPSLLAAGFAPAKDSQAALEVRTAEPPDVPTLPLVERLRLDHRYYLAGHSSHSSHGSHGSHQSHRSGSGSSSVPQYTVPDTTTGTSRNTDSVPEFSVLPSSPAIAPSVTLPGNTAKFKDILVQVQLSLSAYGYYTGVVDGIMGPQTQTAISKFQSAWGLPVTGTITPEVLDAMGIVAQ